METGEIKEYVEKLCREGKESTYNIASLDTNTKNNFLNILSKKLIESEKNIISANASDIEAARQRGISSSLIDRMLLDHKRIVQMAEGCKKVSYLPDPIGSVIFGVKRPNGLEIYCKRVPLGCIGVIYEARPNVTIEITTLAIKSGNAVILKGGSEVISTNKVLVELIKESLKEAEIDERAVQFIETTDRSAVDVLLKQRGFIDVIIPRGSEGLIKHVVENSYIPVIETGIGNCHLYIDESANVEMALKIAINAKTQRPSVCNSIEKVLIHKNIASNILVPLVMEFKKRDVQIRGCQQTLKYVKDAILATEEDWYKEYHDLIVAIKIVKDLREAISHINKYGSKHSEAIVSENYSSIRRFLRDVDASAVYANASTRFTDGGEFGFGAEVGISTQKLHVRGPMGLEALTTMKYVIFGNGQIRT
ncbi:Gamma-glutamyl phosphate reductase [Thermodesulfobium narugense DSM 14796]|uniref:Gamma-glutamyl phosphate reductase n=1 Tax=Thermodesulfobium narugense DSM 14796 TaxID=747365 RepID=M1E6T9_9BACT|nr:glutamate-5-semialdehyde dehydrogenase [Thermodesulfobium narugense]AEE14976.1 Gamma-glutamyl phosphate reductase [Thermodesulfobium narugense DSM 14796]